MVANVLEPKAAVRDPNGGIEIISPASLDQWNAARATVLELITWFAAETGLSLEEVQANARAELRAMPDFYREPNGRFLIAYRDGVALATTGVRLINRRTAEIKRVFVRPEARGLGLAPRILLASLDVAVDLGADTAVLETDPVTMGRAVDLYRSFGFRDRRRYSNLGDHVHGLLTLELVLRRGRHRRLWPIWRMNESVS